MYLWGLYRNSVSGNVFDPVETPTRFGQDIFDSKNPIEKLVSGQHHTLALAKGKVFAWGDAECGKIGRASNTRNKNSAAMRIQPLGVKNAQDIFCGKNTSFYLTKKGVLYAFGQNNHGQLGIGNNLNTHDPSKVIFEDPSEAAKIVNVTGGEHHSVAITSEGKVYAWGRNDEGQVGQGDLYGQYRRQKAQEEYEALMKAEEEKAAREEEEKKQKEEEAR